MSEQKFRSLRSVLVYLRLKGYSQSAAKKELKDVLGEDVSLAWIKKWWGSDIDQLDGKQGEGGGREPRSAATRQIIKRSNPASSLSEVAREVEKKRQKTTSKSLVSKILLGLGLKSFLMGKVSELKPAHVEARLEFARKFVDKPPEFWERVLSTDEKQWVLHKSKQNRSW